MSTETAPKHQSSYNDRILAIRQLQDDTLKISKALFEPNNAIYPTDLLLIAALSRTTSQIAGFISMMEQRNFICAAALLRMQLDTALRVYGSTLVESQNEYSIRVLRGERVSSLRSRDGQKLTDKYLSDTLSKHFEWVPSVYTQTSGFVHLSNRHIFQSLNDFDDQERTVQIKVSAQDWERPEHEYFEILDAFTETTQIVLHLIGSYVQSKQIHYRRQQQAELTEEHD